MNFKSSRGFTLIELLVVVAIISLLTSVVLASLRDAKDKSNNSKITSQLLEMRKLAELNNSNGTYGTATQAGDCGNLNAIFTNAKFNNESSWPNTNDSSPLPVCTSNTQGGGEIVTSYSIWYFLSNSQIQCVDSTGSSKILDTAPSSSVCENSQASSGGTAQWGESCSSNNDCQSTFCGYDQGTQEYGFCTDGYNGILCTSNDQCSSNYCDTAYSYTCMDDPNYEPN